MKIQQHHNGYIALISAILISVSLLTMVIAVSFEGYFSRFNVLESEQKEMSAYLAESCFNTAVLKLSQDVDYTGNQYIHVGSEGCRIRSINNTGAQFSSNLVVRSQASSSGAYTNLQVEIDPDDLPSVTIVNWKEIGSF
jgi:hypothetical protein